MARRDPTNSNPGASRLRSVPAAVGRLLRNAYWAVEDRVLWNGRNALRRVYDVARWPFERLVWIFEAKLVWPLRERLAGRRGPTGAAAVLCAVAVGAIALGAIQTTGDSSESPSRKALASSPLSESEPTATANAEPAEPVLQGAPPVLGLDGAVATTPPPEDPATEEVLRSTEGDGGPDDEVASASASTEPVPAGPDAMKVARRFAEAFVVYEVGEQRALARETFDETAAPSLAGTLAKRPPRLPEQVKVPQAKVVNLVPGPRRGKAYSVSVSLLRVGVTSELRLELRRNVDGWLVTDVRG
ncbi:MAG TPA: hypothetical protein VNO20_11325 [Solirubrobacterales bacterium]|nr:hypothetical protein [Solirubrobacterales bacterium]